MKKQTPKTFKRTVLSTVLSATVILALTIMPNLNNQADAKTVDIDLDSALNAMWNHTQAQTNRVGGAYGGTLGSMNVRTPIKNWTIVSFTPPNFKAGCGGIDAHFGSFSFISTDNIKELMRSIISNAMGYAIQLALENVCKSCSDVLGKFQSITTDINSKAINTCQMSSAAIDWVRGKKNPTDQQSEQYQEGLLATMKGKAGDLFESMGNVFRRKDRKGNSNANREYDAHNKDTRYGNNLLNTYVSADVFNLQRIDTTPYGGDKQFFEIAMSLIGTNIMTTGQEKDSSPDRYVEPIWTFNDLVYGTTSGNELSILSCDTISEDKPTADQCQKVGLKANEWQGVERIVIELLAGDQGEDAKGMKSNQVQKIEADSIMAYLRDQSSVKLNTPRENFVKSMPSAYRTALERVAKTKHHNIQRAAVASAAKSLSKQLAADLAMGIVQTTRQSYNAILSNKETAQMTANQAQAVEKLEKAALRIEEESDKNAQQFLTSINFLLSMQNSIEANKEGKERAITANN